MPYNIQYSNTAKPLISVRDGDLDKQTSLTFIGQNYNKSYSSIIGENFLHLLENFAKSTPPSTPVEGQLWYNSTEGSIEKGLKVFNGSNWISLAVIKKGNSEPPPISPSLPMVLGDLYVDTAKQQLYIFNEQKWTLVGPKYEIGDKTTAEVEIITDSVGNNTRAILTLFVKNNRVAILSDREFTPKIVIDGFPIIRQGITLSTTNFQVSSKITKFWGISEKAESLIIGDTAVSGSNFLRSDVASTTYQRFNVSNNNGISIGADLSLSIGIDPVTSSSIIYNKISGSNISFRLQNSGQIKTVLNIDARGGVGINTAPDEDISLDVVGDIKTDSSIIITGTNDSNVVNPNLPSFKTLGGALISKSLKVNDKLTVGGVSVLGNNTTIQGQLFLDKSTGPVITPVNTEVNDIGSTDLKFNNIYSNNFYGNLVGRSQSARYLSDGIRIGMSSNDINASIITIGDSLTNLTGNLSATLNSQIVYTKPSPDVSGLRVLNPSLSLLPSDLILISRKVNPSIENTNQTLIKLTGDQLFSSIRLTTMQIGSIILWPNVSKIPLGYLLCNGQSLPQAGYQELYTVLGTTNFIDNEISKFNLPNLTPLNGMNYIIYTGKS
jgi:hypothetical protein